MRETWYAAEWQDDCQGKKDYDFGIIGVSCRYYPGSYRRGVWPSCYVSLTVGDLTLFTFDVVGETEAEVKAAVEDFTNEKAKEVRKLVVERYGMEPKSDFNPVAITAADMLAIRKVGN
jgi:hypothetical protein